jgi:GNAT superfamily N-acetyltransferase
MSLTIRRALPTDAPTVVDFNARLAEESEGKRLDRALLEPGVAAALADPHKAVYFLACDVDEPLGQISITYEWSDWRNGWFWWIQSVFVRPEHRQRGVFRALYRHLEELARNDASVIGLRLYVEDENLRAQKTYENLGMQPTTYFVLERYPL